MKKLITCAFFAVSLFGAESNSVLIRNVTIIR